MAAGAGAAAEGGGRGSRRRGRIPSGWSGGSRPAAVGRQLAVGGEVAWGGRARRRAVGVRGGGQRGGGGCWRGRQ